jgi:Domain of unknown function (DUF4124)
MKPSTVFLAWVIGLALSSAVSADIYESVDAEGNPVFTDTPSAGAEIIDLPQTNTADPAPDIAPPPERDDARPATAVQQEQEREQEQQGQDYYYGGDEADRARLEEERRHHQREQGEGAPHAEHRPAAPGGQHR